MRPYLTSLLALALMTIPTATAAVALPGGEELEVSLRGKSFGADELTAELPAGQASGVMDQLDLYRDWIGANDYHASLSQDGRVLLVTSSKKIARRRMKLVEETLESFDGLLSPRTKRVPTGRSTAWGRASEVLAPRRPPWSSLRSARSRSIARC